MASQTPGTRRHPKTNRIGSPTTGIGTMLRSGTPSLVSCRWSKSVHTVLLLLFLLAFYAETRAQNPESSPTNVATNSPRSPANALFSPRSARKKIELERFSFDIPAELKQREAAGIDSAIWRYADNNLDLLIDLGTYSAKPLMMRDKPEYREERTRIDGKKATMVFFRSSDSKPKRPYVAAAYFPSIDGADSKLALYATCASPDQQKVAREIFLSIDFADKARVGELRSTKTDHVLTATQLTEYVWRSKNRQLGRILVPPGFTEETKAYTEGVRTTLTYPDGSYIVLHVGAMIKLPFFTEPQHKISGWRKLSNQVVREGKVRDTELFWREENSYGVWPSTNLGFTNVPRSRVKIFENALASFKYVK